MLNPFKEVNWQPDTASFRSFARSLVIGFPILAIVFLLAGKMTSGAWAPAFPIRLATIGAAAGALFWLMPKVAKPFYFIWYGVACCIGLVIGTIILTLIFYVMVTGIGLLKRLLGRPAIRKSPDRQASTYWLDAPPLPEPARYFRQF